jgi:hypothetical protein
MILKSRVAIISLFVIAAVTIYLASCKKIDSSLETSEGKLEKFFSYQRNAPTVKGIIQSLKNKNNQSGFALKVIQKAGYPLWDKTFVGHSQTARRGMEEGDTIFTYTPFVYDYYQNIQAVLITRIVEEDTTYKCIYANDYAEYPTTPIRGSSAATDVARLFFYFESMVFDCPRMIIKDHQKLFVPPPSDSNLFTASVSLSKSLCSEPVFGIVTICEHLWWDPDGDDDPCDCSGNEIYLGEVGCQEYTIIAGWQQVDCGGSGGGNPNEGGGVPGGLYIPNDPYPYVHNPNEAIGHGPSAPVSSFDGWEPAIPHTPVEEPIDSLLKRTSIAANTVADSLMTISLVNLKKEYNAAIVEKNGLVYVKNIKTDYDSLGTTPDWTLDFGEILLGNFHTHPKYPVSDRSAGSHGDILGLKLTKNFISIVECGNVRYAFVMEDVTKAINFYKHQTLEGLANQIYAIALQQPNWFSNWQGATQTAIAQILGSAATNGIGFYISNNTAKTEYTKLNP